MENIENHKKAALHLEEAVKNHHEAIKHHEAGNYNKAYHSTLNAYNHCTFAAEAQKENLKEYETMI